MRPLLATDNLVQALGWMSVVIVLLGLFWMAWFMLRKWFHGSASNPDQDAAAPWTLQQLRDLEARGEITADEFERLRRQIVGSFRDTD